MSEKMAQEIYRLLRKHYPNMYTVVRGRHHSSELFDFEVKTKRFFGKTLAKGDGTFFGLIGQTIDIQKGSNALIKEFSMIGYNVTDSRRCEQ